MRCNTCAGMVEGMQIIYYNIYKYICGHILYVICYMDSWSPPMTVIDSLHTVQQY